MTLYQFKQKKPHIAASAYVANEAVIIGDGGQTVPTPIINYWQPRQSHSHTQ